MKTTLLVKSLSLSALVALSLTAGLAQAESCILGSSSAPQAMAPRFSSGDTGSAMLSQMEARMNQQMDRIEQGLRNGRISPMQAGKMMREQWEAVQFQRGFLEGSRASGGMASLGGGGSSSCALIDSANARQFVQKMAPVVGGMAREGMQTATTVMRALAQEAGKLLREDAPAEEWY